MKKRILDLLVVGALFASSSFGHEYWLQPENFKPAVGEKTAVRLFVGDGLVKDREERPFQLDKTVVFNSYSSDGSINLIAGSTDKALPFYTFSSSKAGVHLLALERNWSFIKIEAQKFEDYLKDEGMEYIVTERAKLGESQKEGRERYSRYLKCLIEVGGKKGNVYKKTVGQRLEIVPLENPYGKKVGDSLRFRVLFDSKPLAGYEVFADNVNTATQKTKTDASGKFSIKIEKPGLWLVRLVVMRRCNEKDCGEADWQSFWGALSFGA